MNAFVYIFKSTQND